MRVAPLAQRRQGDVELAALRGEPVLEARRALAVRDSLQDRLRHQPVEPVGEDVPRNSEALLELVEPAQPEEDVADDEQRPALADDLERPRDRAVLALVAALQHAETLAESVASRNPLCYLSGAGFSPKEDHIDSAP